MPAAPCFFLGESSQAVLSAPPFDIGTARRALSSAPKIFVMSPPCHKGQTNHREQFERRREGLGHPLGGPEHRDAATQSKLGPASHRSRRYRVSPRLLPNVHSMPPSSRWSPVMCWPMHFSSIGCQTLAESRARSRSSRISADEAGDAGEAAAHILAGIRWHVV
jgi:hypothetical protein